MVSARHGAAAQPQGFGGLKLTFEIDILKLVVNPKTSNSPSPPNILKYLLKNPNNTAEHPFEIGFFVLFVYLFNNSKLILNIH